MAELRGKLMSVPGMMAFLQNPPPITISGQVTTSVYQMTLQSANLQEIYEWAPKLVDEDAHAAGIPWTSTATCRSRARR